MKCFGKLAAATAIVFAVASVSANAAVIVSSHMTSDAQFLDYLGNNGVALPDNELFVAQARGGNNAGNGDYEIGLHIPPNFTNAGPVAPTPGGSTQQHWGTSGGGNDWVLFTLSRVGSTLTFDMGDYEGSWTDAAVGTVDALGLRTRSDFTNGNSSSTAIRNLAVNGNALGAGSDLFAADGGLDFIVIEGLTGDFSLSGEAALNWSAAYFPTGSRLGFQIKGLDFPTGGGSSVSEPAALGLVVLGLVALAAAARRRRT